METLSLLSLSLAVSLSKSKNLLLLSLTLSRVERRSLFSLVYLVVSMGRVGLDVSRALSQLYFDGRSAGGGHSARPSGAGATLWLANLIRRRAAPPPSSSPPPPPVPSLDPRP